MRRLPLSRTAVQTQQMPTPARPRSVSPSTQRPAIIEAGHFGEAAERLAICAASCHLRSVLPSSRQGIEAGHSGESTKRALTVGCYVTGM